MHLLKFTSDNKPQQNTDYNKNINPLMLAPDYGSLSEQDAPREDELPKEPIQAVAKTELAGKTEDYGDNPHKYTHGHPRKTPRYDLRKPKTLPDDDLDDIKQDKDLKLD